MVYGVLRLINFAHGDIFMFGAFVAYYCIAKWQLPLDLVFVITTASTAALGLLVEKVAYKPLRAAPNISLLITAVGVSLFLEYFLSLKSMFTPNYIAFPRPFDVEAYDLGLVARHEYPAHRLRRDGGLAPSALPPRLQDEARQGHEGRLPQQGDGFPHGHQRGRHDLLHLRRGHGACGHRRHPLRLRLPQINVFMGIMPGIKSFIAAVLGGIGLVHGAVLGGLVIGVSEVFVSAFLSSTLRDGVIFIILLLVLSCRPTASSAKGARRYELLHGRETVHPRLRHRLSPAEGPFPLRASPRSTSSRSSSTPSS